MKNKSAFSVIEITIVSAIGGIVMLGILYLFTSLGRSQKSITQSTEFENVTLLIRAALFKPATCITAMQNSAGNPVVAPASMTQPNPDLPANGINVAKIVAGALNVDTSTPYNGLYITEMKLRQISAGNPSNANASPYTLILAIRGSKTPSGAAAAVGGGQLSKDIPLTVLFRKPGGGGPAPIESCSALGGGPSTNDEPEIAVDPVTLIAATNEPSWDAIVAPTRLTAGQYNTWVTVSHPSLVAGKTFAKLSITLGKMRVYLSGKGQSAPGMPFFNNHPGLLAAQATPGSSNTVLAQVPLEDDGTFKILAESLDPGGTWGMVISLVGLK